MIDVLNMLPLNLIVRIFVTISGVASIAFFVLSLGQIIHSIWDLSHPKADWYQLPEAQGKKKFSEKSLEIHQIPLHFYSFKNSLVRWFWIGWLIIVLLMILLPWWHL